MASISPAEIDDIFKIAKLLQEMDRSYGATEFDPIHDRAREIQESAFTRDNGINLLAAKNDDGVLVGIASYSYLWPAIGLTRSLYLKELYVSESHRKQGIGRALMATLQEIAAKNGCSRIEWTTDRENVSAQHFYALLGFEPLPSKIFYRSTPALVATKKDVRSATS